MTNRLLTPVLFFLLLALTPACAEQQPEIQTNTTGATSRENSSGVTGDLYMPSLALIDFIDLPAGVEVDFSKPSRFRLHTTRVKELTALISPCHHGAPPEADGDSVVVTIDHDSCKESLPVERHQTPSFSIDYDTPIFNEIIKDVKSKYGSSPSLSDLSEYTNRFIEKKSSASYVSFASTIARQKSGDCKEHAIFATALARIFGYKSKVVLGLVLIKVEGDSWIGFGHAWPEAYDEESGNWIGFDATQVRQSVDNGYIPLMELTDEGPTYMTQLMQVAQHGIHKIQILGYMDN